MKKASIHALFATFILFAFSVTSSLAAVDCKQTINTTCTGCHEKSLICSNVEKPAKYWKEMIKLMISNGADISDDERTALVTCLSAPEAACKEACK